MQYERLNIKDALGVEKIRFDLVLLLEELRTEYEPIALRQKQTILFDSEVSFFVVLDR